MISFIYGVLDKFFLIFLDSFLTLGGSSTAPLEVKSRFSIRCSTICKLVIYFCQPALVREKIILCDRVASYLKRSILLHIDNLDL
jgi:hypothetical protein